VKNIFQSKNHFWNLTALLIFIAVIYFLVVPVSRVLLGSLQTQEGGAWTLENFLTFTKYRTYWRSLANSIGVSLAASALTIVLAVPLPGLSCWAGPESPPVCSNPWVSPFNRSTDIPG
jgi:ABC-type uncharacterized transport system permease subunit